MSLDSIDDLDAIDVREQNDEAARRPKRTLIEQPFVKKRINENQIMRIEPTSRLVSANADYLANTHVQEGYLIKERGRDSSMIGKNGKEIPAHLSDEAAEKLKSPETKQIEAELAEWREKGERLNAENKKAEGILRDRTLYDRLKQRSQELGYRTNVEEHTLEEADYDEEAYQDSLITIGSAPAKLRKLTVTASHRSLKEMRSDIPAQLAKAKARWQRNMRLGGFTKRKPTRGQGDVPPAMMDGPLIPGVGVMPVPTDALAFVAEFFPEKFTEMLERQIEDFATKHDVAAATNAAKQIDELRARLREAEIVEEQMIRAAQKVGIMLPRRDTARLGIVFDYRLKK